MQRTRSIITFALLALSLFVATTPVFAADTKGPGNPVLPEAPLAILLPLVGLAVIGLVLFIVYRRRQRTPDTTAE